MEQDRRKAPRVGRARPAFLRCGMGDQGGRCPPPYPAEPAATAGSSEGLGRAMQ